MPEERPYPFETRRSEMNAFCEIGYKVLRIVGLESDFGASLKDGHLINISNKELGSDVIEPALLAPRDKTGHPLLGYHICQRDIVDRRLEYRFLVFLNL